MLCRVPARADCHLPLGWSTKYAFLDILIGVIRSRINPGPDCINWVEAVALFVYSVASPRNNASCVFPSVCAACALSGPVQVNKPAFRESVFSLRSNISDRRLGTRSSPLPTPHLPEDTRLRQWSLPRVQGAAGRIELQIAFIHSSAFHILTFLDTLTVSAPDHAY